MQPSRDEALSAVKTILKYIGEDPDREGLLRTPERVVRSWDKLYGGYKQKLEDVVKADFDAEGYDQIVMLDDIEFWSTCEHHVLPFYGKVSVGYLPDKKTKRVIGVSKMARIVEMYARRLQIQERMTQQIANALKESINAEGVGVVVRARHLCMVARGVQKQQSWMVTSEMLGSFRNETATRQEFIRLIEIGRQ